ncbi:MAG: hypothetical protein QXJ75_04165 [Candidatus Bathyarchaeia archaeon]
MPHTMDQQLQSKIESLCQSLSAPSKIVAVCLIGSESLQGLGTDNLLLVVLEDFLRGIKIAHHKLEGSRIRVLQVDRVLFEEDVTGATLGELAAGWLSLPYIPLKNPSYLKEKEIRLKKEIILRSIENLVKEYSSLAGEILIENRFFVFDEIARRLKMHPAMWWGFYRSLSGNERDTCLSQVEEGYKVALKELEGEGKITFLGDLVKVKEDFVTQCLSKRFPKVALIKSLEKVLRSRIFRGYAGVTSPLDLLRELISEIGFELRLSEKAAEGEILDPKRFLILPSKDGFIRLCDETSIEDYVEREGAFSGKAVEIRKLGGVLNNVYLLLFRDDGVSRVVVKKFEEWADFKWLPIAMWAIGAQNFSVRAKSRLARECAASLYLREHKFATPSILRVSWNRSLLFKEFIDGQRLDKLIKGVIRSGAIADDVKSILWRAGKTLAEIHSVDFTIGDNKPENIVACEDGRIYFVDLEQAGKGGNKPWDLAEFVYYSAHYALPTDPMKGIDDIISSFSEGYIAGGGSKDHVKKITSHLYVNKFVPLVIPSVLLEARSLLKRLC